MQTLSVSDSVQVTIYCNFASQWSVNIVNYVVGSISGTSITDTDLATILDAQNAGLYAPLLANVANYVGTKVQIIGPTRRPAQLSVAGQTAGTAGAEPCPTQTCGLIKVTTDLTGPRNRGRLFLPFPSESSNTVDGKPDATYLVNAGDLADTLFQAASYGGANSASLVPCVYSRKYGSFETITGYGVEFDWATLRKRALRMRGDAPPI